jgi:hypothetical protein
MGCITCQPRRSPSKHSTKASVRAHRLGDRKPASCRTRYIGRRNPAAAVYPDRDNARLPRFVREWSDRGSGGQFAIQIFFGEDEMFETVED